MVSALDSGGLVPLVTGEVRLDLGAELARMEEEWRRAADRIAQIRQAFVLAACDPLLNLRQIQERTGRGRYAVMTAVRSGELEAVRGSRNALLSRQSKVDAWAAKTPYVAPPKKCKPREGADADAQRFAQLARVIGGTR